MPVLFIVLLAFLVSPLRATDLWDAPNTTRARLPVIALHPKAPEVSLYQTPTPRWVTLVSLPVATQPRSDERVEVLLIDRQTNVDSGTIYHHVAKKIKDLSAIREHAFVAMTFDPSYQAVDLHTLVIHRHGEKLNEAPAVDFHLLPTERIEGDIPPGQQWALVTVLEDVREGDIIEYSYSLQGFHPSHMQRMVDECPFQYLFPVERLYYRVTGIEPCRAHFRVHHMSVLPVCQQFEDEGWEWVCHARQVPTYHPEQNHPSWYEDSPWVQMSEFQDWAEVARWGADLFRWPKKVPQGCWALVKGWKGQYASEEARILAAVRFVQDEIALLDQTSELHWPSDVDQTIQRKACDGMDKAYLLKTLLGLMGIDSVPAGVHSWDKHAISDLLPSPAAFDRVILQVKSQHGTYWVDPCAFCQGGRLQRNTVGRYERALPFEPSAQELLCLSSPITDEPDIRSTSTYYLWPDKLDTSILVETTFSDDSADWLRARLRKEGNARVQSIFLNAYRQAFGDTVSIAFPGEILDDREANRILVREHYHAKNIWQVTEKGRQKQVLVAPHYLLSSLTPLSDALRKGPLSLPCPSHIVETMHFIAPGHTFDSRKMEQLIATEGMTCSLQTHASEDALSFSGDLKILADHVAPEAFDAYRDALARVVDGSQVLIDIPAQQHYAWDITFPLTVNLYLAMAIGFLAIDPRKKA